MICLISITLSLNPTLCRPHVLSVGSLLNCLVTWYDGILKGEGNGI